jgi:O-antigen/teichoic acid export membrane protein
VLFLSLWRSEIDIGYYSAAYRLTEALRLLPGAVVITLYPLMAQASTGDGKALTGLLTSGLKPLLAVMIPICTGISFFAKPLIELFYTASYIPAGDALALLVWTELGVTLTIPLSYALIAIDRRGTVVQVTFVMLVVNIVLNIVMIPTWGYLGASLATVLTEGVGLIGYGIAVRRVIGWSFWNGLRPLAPGIGCFLLWMVVARLFPLPLAAASAALVYGLGLWMTRGVTREEIMTLKDALVEKKWRTEV